MRPLLRNEKGAALLEYALLAAIATNSDTPRLGNNLGYDLSGLVLEAE